MQIISGWVLACVLEHKLLYSRQFSCDMTQKLCLEFFVFSTWCVASHRQENSVLKTLSVVDIISVLQTLSATLSHEWLFVAPEVTDITLHALLRVELFNWNNGAQTLKGANKVVRLCGISRPKWELCHQKSDTGSYSLYAPQVCLYAEANFRLSIDWRRECRDLQQGAVNPT